MDESIKEGVKAAHKVFGKYPLQAGKEGTGEPKFFSKDEKGNYRCTTCGALIAASALSSAFRNEISRREYMISGMCQRCQDLTFGKDEPEPEIMSPVSYCPYYTWDQYKTCQGQSKWNPEAKAYTPHRGCSYADVNKCDCYNNLLKLKEGSAYKFAMKMRGVDVE